MRVGYAQTWHCTLLDLGDWSWGQVQCLKLTLGRLAKLSLGRPLEAGVMGKDVLSKAWEAAAKFSPAQKESSVWRFCRKTPLAICLIFCSLLPCHIMLPGKMLVQGLPQIWLNSLAQPQSSN